jgi:flagellar protein FliL
MADTVAVTAPAARGGKRKLVLVVLVLAAVAAGAVGGKMLLAGDPGVPGEEVAAAPAPAEGEVVTVAKLTASLAGGGSHYARVEFGAVLADTATAAAVEPRFPLLKDLALSTLMGFEPEELRTVAGADRLRQELTARAGEVFPDGEVLRIVLTELLVQ